VKRAIVIVILLFGLSRASFAVILFCIDAPHDSADALCKICGRPELKPLHAAYDDLIETRIFPRKADDFAKGFGPPIATVSNRCGVGLKRPTDRVLPIFASGDLMVSGLSATNDRSHTDIHAVGDIGYVEFYYGWDGKSVLNAVIYFRTDTKFVALTSANDYGKRLKWEKARFDALEKWLNEHLPKQIDLGVVEVSPTKPRRLDLGGGSVCVLTASILMIPNSTKLCYKVDITKDNPGRQGQPEFLQQKTINRPDESIGFKIDGKFFRLTPKLVEQFIQPSI
jgi:hypothetical protein